MKEIIIVMDQDPIYSKKFCNQAIKLYGKKYLFITFQNIKRIKEYAEENSIEALIISEEFLSYVDDIKTNAIYILNEKNKTTKREGKKTFVYKLQNIKEILSLIELDIEKKMEKKKKYDNKGSKLVLFYSPIYIKNKIEFIKKVSKSISKKKKVLIVDFDEFDNYKGTVGLSNIIYHYKENKLSVDTLKREVVCEKEQDYIKSVTYPDDYNVVTNIDLANIVNEFKNLDYDYLFINSDLSFTKCQYIANDSDLIMLINDKENDKVNIFKNYIRSENQLDYNKIIEFDVGKSDKAHFNEIVKVLIS